MAALIAALEPLLPQRIEVAAAATVDGEKLQESCSELERLLGANDFASGQLFEDNAPLLRAGLGASYAPLAEALEAYDYPRAHEVLTAALAAAGR